MDRDRPRPSSLLNILDAIDSVATPATPPITLDVLLAMLRACATAPAPKEGLAPTVRLDGIDILVSDLVPRGLMVPLGPRAFVIARADYDENAPRRVLPFPREVPR